MSLKRALAAFLLVSLLVFAAGCRDDNADATPTPEAATATAVSRQPDASLPTASATPRPSPTPASLGLVSLDAAAPVAPSVVGQMPDLGQEAPLDGSFDIVFDQPMDPATTARALQVLDPAGEPVPGEVSWPQPRILRFKPAARLNPDAEYRAVLADSAAAADGTSLLDGLTLSFYTIGDLAVSQVSPADGVTDVALDSALTVIFNRPVIPLQVDQSGLRSPDADFQALTASLLSIDPPVSGAGEWINTSVFVFRPDDSFVGSTTYTARVNAEAVNALSATGAVMAADAAWQFTTAAPTYRYLNLPGLASSPRSDYKYLPLDQPIEILFAQPMDPVSTETAVSLTNDEGAAAAYASGWNADFTTLTITPTQLLDLGTWYNVTLADTAQAAGGGTLRFGLSWRAKTYLPPEVFFTEPADGDVAERFTSGFTVQFVSPMRLSSLRDRVVFNPPIESEGIFSEWDWSYRFYGLEPATEYTVQILPGMSDIYGNTIDEGQTVTFTTGDYEPIAYFNQPGRLSLYRPAGSTAAWAAFRNVSQLTAALYPITRRELDGLLFGDIVDVRFTPPADPVWEQTLSTADAPRNTLTYRRFDLLSPDGSPLPPGLYFLTIDAPEPMRPYPNAPHLQGQPIVVATANVTLKWTTTEALAWVTDLDSGAPLAGVPVALVDAQFNDIRSGETDANGLVYWDGLNLGTRYDDRYYAIADGGDDAFGLAIHSWTDGVEPWNFGINTDYYLQPDQPTAYVYTDRPIYRPDQTVYLKGIVRLNDDLAYSLPGFDTVNVSVNSYDGPVFDEAVPLSELGSFEIEIELDAEATLGSYWVSIQRGNQWLGSGYFDVAEYRKPTFQVEVTADQTAVSAGDNIDVTVEARFFSGGSVVNGRVDWVVIADPFTFQADGSLRRFSFQDFERDYYYYGDYGSGGGELIASGSGSTDARGQFAVSIPADLSADSGSRTFAIEASVTDVASNMVSGRTRVVVHRSLVYPGIAADRYVGTAGDEMAFDLAVVDWDGEPVANQPVTVEVVERRWYSVQEENEAGEVIWRSSVEEIPVDAFTDVTTDGSGRASVTFTPPRGGVYRAYVRTRDARGVEATASTYLWVSGGDYVAWRRTSDRAFDLVADQESYRPGDTAELLIASPFQGEAVALVTVERGHIKSYDVVPLETNSTIYRLPITGDMAPNVFVSVLVIKGVDANNPAPDFKVGIAQFSVERDEQALSVEVIPDRDVVGPGDTVEYTVRVRDFAGSPVDAEVSLALADLAALSIAAPNSPPILDYFYSERFLSVATALLLTRNMDAFNQELQEQIKGGGGGGGDFGVLEIREDFPDTAYWEGQLQTGPDGEATVSITLPDSLTTWRMDARAVTADTLVGQTTVDIMSTKPVLVSPLTPRFFVVGDEAQVGTAVHNNTDASIEANVTLQAAGVVLHSPDTQVITIPPRQQGVVRWNLKVNDVERVDFVFSVNAGEFSDASRPTLGTLEGQGIPVYKFEVPETVGTAGQLVDGGAVVESIALPILPGYTPEQGDVTIELAPSLVAAMVDGLDYLEHYPYECTEQIVSRFLPNVLTTAALQAAGLSDPALERALQNQVAVALQRLRTRQLPDGGWPWWDGPNSSTLVTAYVVQALLEARDAGYDVQPWMITNGLRYLRENLPDVDGLDGRYKYNRQAYLVYVLARADDFNAAEMERLYERRESLNLYARGYLAQAIHRMDPEDPRLETLAADFITAAIFSATGVHWEEAERDYWNWNTDTRTTAILLDTMIKLQPDSPLVANAVRWLMDTRTAGRWSSTQETAWALLSLTSWLNVSGELQPDYQYEVALNGELLTSAEVTPATVRDTVTLQRDITALLLDDLNRLAIGRTDGPGNLYYTAHLNVWLPVEQVLPLDKGIILSRSYFDPADRETPVTQAALGDTLLARLTIVVPNSLHYVVIDDFLPAGLEGVDTSLLTSQQQGAPERYDPDDFWGRGYGWWYFDHVELRDEKVVISADYLPAGTYEYVYLVRASTLGEFRVIPPTGQEFYFPEVYGRGAGSLFTVVAADTAAAAAAADEAADAADEAAAVADEADTADEAADTADEAAAFVETRVFGQSAGGEALEVTRIGVGETAVLLVGGMHAGFAPASVALAARAIDHFTQFSDTLPAGITLYVVPNLNPDSVGGAVEALDGRVNANGVDLNRNWGCNWNAEASWRDQPIPAGDAPFSEPETRALRDLIREIAPAAVLVFEARGEIVVPGVCDGRSISEELAQVYADAAGYEAGIISLTTVTGDVTDWLDSQGIPAVAPLLADYETLDWEANLAGIAAVLTAVGD